MTDKITAHSRFYLPVIALLALALFLGFSGLARAEDSTDPPRLQTATGYNIEFVAPPAGGAYRADTDLLFRFRVTDSAGKPASGLQLYLTAIRDYSGQVTREHNGPRTPNVGPITLTAAPNPGEYQATTRIGFNGHWFIQVDGPSLGQEKVKFRLPIGAADNKGAGINLDWLLWVGVLLTVITVVTIVGRKGEVFPTPVEELQPPVKAENIAGAQQAAAADPVASDLIKK
ncbi:MAG TPA: hypothetical protein VH186_24225 [Chloroflexia bacterium]|nr:hypothetical protein [Chloroflexia bacterium]